MQENKGRGTAYAALSLLVISGIIAFLVAFVNSVTAPTIEKHNEEVLRANIESIFKGNSGFEDVTDSIPEVDGVVAVYRVLSGTGGQDSYCIHSSAPGYGGMVEMLVGFNCDGEITGVSVLSAEGETPGVGQRITGQGFLDGFKGLSYNQEGAKVDGISGATVSSGAALKAVNSACLAMEALLSSDESSSQEVQ